MDIHKLYYAGVPSLKIRERYEPLPADPEPSEGAPNPHDPIVFTSSWDIEGELLLSESEDLLLLGEVSYELERCCARCLRTVRRRKLLPLAIVYRDPRHRPIRDELQPEFRERGGFEGLKEWVELLELYPSGTLPAVLRTRPQYLKNDYPVYPWTEREPDILSSLREQILLSLEPRFICAEDCAGLCPICGRAFENPTCSCGAPAANGQGAARPEDRAGADVRYPFAGLAALLEQQEDGIDND